MNVIPTVPDLSCPIPTPDTPGYYNNQQSVLNVNRKDKFRLIMDIPAILKPYIKNDTRFCNMLNLDRLDFSIWGYVVPPITVPKSDVKFGGQSLKVSTFSRPVYPEVTVNFTVDNKFDNYFLLYTWLNLQNDDALSIFNASNLGGKCKRGVISDYSSTFTVQGLSEYNKPLIEWVYHLSFITSLGGINASSRDGGENESSFTFDFANLTLNRITI